MPIDFSLELVIVYEHTRNSHTALLPFSTPLSNLVSDNFPFLSFEILLETPFAKPCVVGALTVTWSAWMGRRRTT